MDCAAVVRGIDGDFAIVEAASAGTACGSCRQAEACTSSRLSGLLRGQRTVRLSNRIGAAVGDRVVLSIAEGAVLSAALFAYLLPLSLLLAGALAGLFIFHRESMAVAGALGGLGVGLALLHLKQKRLETRGELLLTMRIEQVASNGSTGIS